MATAEQLGALLNQLANLAQALHVLAQVQQPQRQGQGPTASRKHIDIKHIKVLGFEGLHASFNDWALAFKRTIRSVNTDAYNLLARVENEVAVDEGELDIQYKEIDVHAYSADLHDVMCHASQGEALAVIRTVDDMKGLEAWNKLYKKFNPRAFARLIGVAVPYRLRLRKQDFETHGFSPKCLCCKILSKESRSIGQHSAEEHPLPGREPSRYSIGLVGGGPDPQ